MSHPPFRFDETDPLDRFSASVAEDEADRQAAQRNEQQNTFEELLDEIEFSIAWGDFEGDTFIEGARTQITRLMAEMPRPLWSRNPRVYWAILMVEFEATDDDGLIARFEEVSRSPHYKRAKMLAKESNPELSGRITELEREVQRRAEEAARLKAEAERKAREAAEKAEAERKAREAAEKAEAERKRRYEEEHKYDVGRTITFGRYEQGSGKAPIEWQVLVREGKKALLISKYVLDARAYNKDYVGITWANCTLRSWLNGEFLQAAFNAEEQKKILQSSIQNPNNPSYGTNGGSSTTDRLFLLSIDEVKKYFSSDSARLGQPTAYAKSRGVDVDSSGNAWWWLRSPGYFTDFAAHVSNDGGINECGHCVDDERGGARPALWINLES